MRKKLLEASLKIIHARQQAPAWSVEELFSFLEDQAIVVPNPGYGNIVYDVPDDYAFPAFTALLDRALPSLQSYFLSRLATYYAHPNLNVIPEERQDNRGFYWNNGFYPPGDARILYAMLAPYRPARMIEMGVGNSTRIARKAILDFDLPTRIVSIDPSPRANIDEVTDQHIPLSITTVDTEIFTSMKPGEFLFLDGSHVCHVGTDVPHYMMNILPLIPAGVFVHIHDIFLPWEYPGSFRTRHFNEQHVLGSMLINSNHWETVFPVHYAHRRGVIAHRGGAYWMQRMSSNPVRRLLQKLAR